MRPSPTARPRLAPGCRLTETPDKKNDKKTMLMIPERSLPLLGPSLQIVQRCDGRHTVAEIIAQLRKLYAKAKPGKVEQDVLDYLDMLHEKRALDYE